MANEAEQAIYTRLASAPTFHPVTADLFVNDWGLDAGDIVTVRSGETDYSVPIYNMSLDWRGSAMAQIQSTGNKERKPLSALKRKQFASGRAGYRAEQKVDEQGVIYDGKFEVTNRHVTSVLSATGVKLDENGDPVMVYNPATGEYEYDYDEQGGNLASRITQTAGEISTEVAARTAQGVSFNSRITQTANSISQIVQAVGRNGEVTAASIALAINANGSQAVIAADHIELDGDTVASILYGKQVEVDEINAETADFTEMDVEERLSVNGDMTVIGDATFTSITLDGNSFSSVVTDFNISGNALTLYRSDGTSETFRKATSLSGSWSGLTYTVAALPAGTLEPLVTRFAMQTPTGTGVSCDVNLVEFTDPEDPTQTTGRGSRTLYLKEKDGFSYITNTDADPTSSNTLAKKAISGGSGSIESVTAGGWTWTNSRYQNIVTATASDETSDTTTVLLPEITCNAGLGNSSNFSVYAYGPGDSGGTSHIVSSTKNFYLKTAGNYIYVTNANADPVDTVGDSGRNVVARMAYDGGIASTGIYSSDASTSISDYNSWDCPDIGTIINGGYYRLKADANNGTSVYAKFKAPAAPNVSIYGIATPAEYASYTTLTDVTASIHYGTGYRAVISDNNNVGIKFLVPADRYNDGWAAAYGKVVLPSQMTISSNNIVTVKTPPSAVDGAATTTNLYLCCSATHAYIRSVDSTDETSGTTYARIANPGGASSVTVVDDNTSLDYETTTGVRVQKGSQSYGSSATIGLVIYVTLSNGKRYRRNSSVSVAGTSYDPRSYTLKVVNNNTGTSSNLSTKTFYWYRG